MDFRAEMALFGRWCCWFDGAWFQAVPLTEPLRISQPWHQRLARRRRPLSGMPTAPFAPNHHSHASIIVVDPETKEVALAARSRFGLEDLDTEQDLATIQA